MRLWLRPKRSRVGVVRRSEMCKKKFAVTPFFESGWIFHRKGPNVEKVNVCFGPSLLQRKKQKKQYKKHFFEKKKKQTNKQQQRHFKEEPAEVIQSLRQDCIQGRLAGQIMDFALPPMEEVTSCIQWHSSCHRSKRKRRLCARLCFRSASTSTWWTRASQEVPSSEVAQGQPGRDSEEELLEAAMARARVEEDEFLQAVPQDETMKERQAEQFFR